MYNVLMNMDCNSLLSIAKGLEINFAQRLVLSSLVDGINSSQIFSAGLSWHRLPPVTPQQIHVARQIRKLCSGDLEEPVSQFTINRHLGDLQLLAQYLIYYIYMPFGKLIELRYIY